MSSQKIVIRKFRFGKHEEVTIKGEKIIADHFKQYKKSNEFTGKLSHIIELVTFKKRSVNLDKKIFLISPNNDKKYFVIEKFFKV
jgi:hypothetical protein